MWTANPDVFEPNAYGVTNSCPVSYRTINQHAGTTLSSKSRHHRMRVGRVDRRIRFELKNCGFKTIRIRVDGASVKLKSMKVNLPPRTSILMLGAEELRGADTRNFRDSSSVQNLAENSPHLKRASK